MSANGRKVTIITPSFNQGAYIRENLLSVRNQAGVEVEHIVVDGGSTDETVAILREFPDVIWSSGPDRGQADALNKGLARATGDLIGWINSDDLLVENALAEVVAAFEDPATDWVVGNLTTYFEATGATVRNPSPRVSLPDLLANPDIVRQQSTFFRRSALDRVGGWDHRYYMTMDYDLWVRLARHSAPVMVDRFWAVFRIHRFQKTSRKNLLRQLAELTEIMQREGASPAQVRRLRLGRWRDYAKAGLKEVLMALGLIDRKYQAQPLRLPKSTAP